MVSLFIVCPVQNVSASQTEYYFTASSSDSGGNYTVNLMCTPPNDIKSYAVLFDTYMHVVFAHPDTTIDPSFDGQYYKTYEDSSTVNINLNIYDNWSHSEFINQVRNLPDDPIGIIIPFSGDYDTNIPVFNDFDSLANYLESGGDIGNTDDNLDYDTTYYMNTSRFDNFWFDINVNIPINTNIYAYYVPSGPSYMMLCIVDDSADGYYYASLDGNCNGWLGGIDISRITILSKNQLTNGYYNGLPSSIGMIYVSNNSAYTTNIPCFDSYDSFLNYLSTGNTDGWLNKPEIDYSGNHNFSNDEFLTSIPLPQLSSISHLGFTVDNLPDDMFIDVVAEFNFYGQHMKDDKICTDFNWLYDSAQYDFTKSDFANNNPVITIKDFYDINPVEVYWSFFENWSAAYPNLEDIPGYVWYNFTLNGQYLNRYTIHPSFDSSTDSAKLTQLKFTNAIETVYYIRFYNEQGHAGQWIKYVFRDKLDKGIPVGGSIISGAVSGSTPTGKPIIDTTINGDIDSDGNINLNPPINDFTFNTDMDFSNFTYLLETSTNVLQQFPLFISQLFLFLPWWVNALIACAIAMCILLRIVGR